MSILVIETGAGVAGANSYVSAGFCNTYFSNRGITAWAGSTTVKESAILRAMSYVDHHYSWVGYTTTTVNNLKWPRRSELPDLTIPATDQIAYGIVGPDGWEISLNVVPQQVKDAIAEMALRSLVQTTLQLDASRGGRVKREKVDVLEVEYFNDARPGTAYTLVDDLLRGFYKQATSFSMARGN